MKVIIAGSRDIRRYIEVAEAVRDSGFEPTEVVSGGAAGVDAQGEWWATRNLVPVKIFRPEYAGTSMPKRAPLERNEKMADYADALVAVWNGRSTGTAHIIGCMRRRGKPVFIREVK